MKSSERVYRQKGFTLIELMIAVAIIGILMSIAYPSYQSHMVSSSRAVAQADLMAFAGVMERHKAANFSYAGAANGGADTGGPAIFQTYSPSGEPVANKKYDLTIETVSASGTSYRLKATPVNGGMQSDDGPLYIYSDGRKGWDKNKDGNLAVSEYCWSC
jgi:type IV pilus assembly protein PilE